MLNCVNIIYQHSTLNCEQRPVHKQFCNTVLSNIVLCTRDDVLTQNT